MSKKIINWSDKSLITEVLLWMLSPERGEGGVSATALKKFIAGVIGRTPPTTYMTSFLNAAKKFYPDLEIIAEGKGRGTKYMVSCKSLVDRESKNEPAKKIETTQQFTSQAEGTIVKEYHVLADELALFYRLLKVIIKGSEDCTLFSIQRVFETTTLFPFKVTEKELKKMLKENPEFSLTSQNGETRVTLVKDFSIDEPEQVESLWLIPDPIMQENLSNIPGVTVTPFYPGSEKFFLIKHKNLAIIQDQIVDQLLLNSNSFKYDDERGILLLSSSSCYRYSLIMGYKISTARRGAWRKGYLKLSRPDKSDLTIRQGECELYK
jgi:hypothetical protein